ncbi:ATP-binding protein [Kitasatospora sp. NPDC097643]|uniref:HD domain-containing protein n=1 Tax=Kitasatospora sp. NPDC097643 TaxID=3157230 RepID=UPI00331F5C22
MAELSNSPSGVANTLSGTVYGASVQAGRIEHLHLGGPPPDTTDGEDAWVRCAARSVAWRHVRADRDVEPYRRAALAVVRELARLRDEAARTEDPWQDDGIATRFAERAGWLLGEPGLDLYPAEAALLVVVPFLYRVRSLRLVAGRAAVRPTELQSAPGADGDRLSYERFVESYDLLTHRARTRPDCARPLGWWLFHRWLAQDEDLADPDGVRELLDLLPALAELGETFAPQRICALLHGLRRGPDVANRDHLAGLREDDHLRAPGEQHVREQRLALLLALAYGVAIELTALPEIVAEHIGIPHEVDLAELRRTLDQSAWGGSYDLPVLRAQCHHEAVVEGLREYTARADELLHTVRRLLPGHPLPTRLACDEAAPAAGAFTGWARFRLDERRVRSLLMGVELYRDRDLAVRELYQNALDACRYRRARTEYLDRTHPLASYRYDGRIEFRQGVDEQGRAYLECLDNGVGMGEAELRGVFSNAGARFAEQLDFKLERAAWRQADPPVELYPNSRFGIGVLSYFMLADEIEVTTCRMDASGELGPLLHVAIHGPGHLFRIVERACKRREPGTVIRLHLRDDIDLGDSWSAVGVLERLLGMAEFATTAVHGEKQASWEPGVLRVREASAGEPFGLNAHGTTVAWPDAPEGAQVTWCEHGGALLVDGLIVEPEAVRGVLSRGGGGLTGAVVNLSGPFAPARLSVDRRRVMDDLSQPVGELLTAAAEHLVRSGSPLFSLEWLDRVAQRSAQLADLVTAEAVRQGRRLDVRGRTFDLGRTGCFPADPAILHSVGFRSFYGADPGWLLDGPPDHVVLWRLLAHGCAEQLSDLGRLCPELLGVRSVRVAMPSDLAVLASRGARSRADRWRRTVENDWVAGCAYGLGIAPEEVVVRAQGLGLVVPEEPVRGAVDADLLRELLETFRGPESAVAASPQLCRLVSVHLNGANPWLRRSEPVPAAHVLRAAKKEDLPISEVVETLSVAGFQVATLPEGARVEDLELFEGGDTGSKTSYWQVFKLAELRKITLCDAVEVYRAYGTETAMAIPHEPSLLDLLLFSTHGPMDWSGLAVGDVVPFARLIEAARLDLAPSVLAGHLRSRGIATSCEELPVGLTLEEARELIAQLVGRSRRRRDERYSLARLLRIARENGRPAWQIVEWFHAWGVDVPDAAEMIRAALARVPFADPA